MQESWVPGALTMIFGTLFGLQGVSSNETVNNCEDLIVFITLLVIIVLLCICGLVMSKCKRLHHDPRAADHQTPPDAPSIAPLESIWVTSLDPLPTYSQVVLNSTRTEPPPPYSLRPERPTGQRRGTRYATI
nr:transmembrane protein 92-like [Rattus norvegicus]|eukprot:XP_017453294.1 PREDICTED: transmembrane protein 92-like [Rattus norvegicus]